MVDCKPPPTLGESFEAWLIAVSFFLTVYAIFATLRWCWRKGKKKYRQMEIDETISQVALLAREDDEQY